MRRDLLIFALSIIKDECVKHESCGKCPFYNSKEYVECGIKRDVPASWCVPDYSDEEIEPIEI